MTKQKGSQEDKLFNKALALINVCRDEHLFTTKPDQYDCDFCPIKEICNDFWNSTVTRFGLGGKNPFSLVREQFKKYHQLKKLVQRYREISSTLWNHDRVERGSYQK